MLLQLVHNRIIAFLCQPPYPVIMIMNSCLWDVCLVSFDETKLKDMLAWHNTVLMTLLQKNKNTFCTWCRQQRRSEKLERRHRQRQPDCHHQLRNRRRRSAASSQRYSTLRYCRLHQQQQITSFAQTDRWPSILLGSRH